MSSSTAARGTRRPSSAPGRGRSGARARSAAARRARIRRARRRLGLLAGLGLVAVLVVLVLPLAKRAVVTEFGLPLQYAATIRQQGAEKHVPPALIAAVIYAETRFDPRTSPTGAEGLMQIEPQTAEFLARRSGGYRFHLADLDSPSVNTAYGSYYRRYLLNRYAGNRLLALAAYNGGENNVDRWIQSARLS